MNDDTIQALRNHALADQAKTLPRTEAAFASWSPRSIREEFERMERDLARMTAELEHHKSVNATTDAAHRELSREHAALRARSAELEAQIERDAWTLSPEMVQTRNDQLAAKLEQAEQRNAELVAALEKIAKSDPLANGRYAAHNAAQALARAESATPDHIPDAAKMVSATPAKQEAAR